MKKFFSFIGLIIFIGANLFLIQLNEDKVDHLNYITKWKKLENGSLYETLRADGVIIPAENNHVFLQDNLPFKEFLVEKGDVVESGTPLFEYESEQIEEQVALLDAEIAKLKADEKSIDSYIDDLEKMKFGLPDPTPVYYFDEEYPDEENRAHSQKLSLEERSLSLDSKIAESELEKEKVHHAIRLYEDQRKVVESGRDGLTVLSSYDGIIDDISFDLANPVLTIVSELPVVKARLFEDQVAKVEDGMRVNMTSESFNDELIGSVSKVNPMPVEEPQIDRASTYEFTIALDNLEDGLYVGYHVDTEVVLDETENVPVVEEKSLLREDVHKYLWTLDDEGFVRKKEIKTGLSVGKEHEVTHGAAIEDVYVLEAADVSAEDRFITPFNPKSNWIDTWKNSSSRKIIKYVLVGIFQK